MNKGVSILGIAVGGVVDVVLSMLLNTLFLVAWVLPKLSGQSGAEMTEIIKGAIAGNSTVLVVTFVIGSLCSILGGYVAATVAKRKGLLNGALSTWLCVLMGLYALISKDANAAQNPILHIAAIPISISLGALGGYLRGPRT